MVGQNRCQRKVSFIEQKTFQVSGQRNVSFAKQEIFQVIGQIKEATKNTYY